MIRVIVRTGVGNRSVIVPASTSPEEVFSQQGIDLSGRTVNINGDNIPRANISKSLEELGYGECEEIKMFSVVKGDGGNN